MTCAAAANVWDDSIALASIKGLSPNASIKDELPQTKFLKGPTSGPMHHRRRVPAVLTAAPHSSSSTFHFIAEVQLAEPPESRSPISPNPSNQTWQLLRRSWQRGKKKSQHLSSPHSGETQTDGEFTSASASIHHCPSDGYKAPDSAVYLQYQRPPDAVNVAPWTPSQSPDPSPNPRPSPS